ncbi:MAG: diguanylate cyclase, partial [Gemmatimonadaceae bacterium]|nr:diguanylate cyclase [Gemmatimonadaceae bacterium]
FKAINDSQGHLAGDAALVLVAELLRTTLRAGDLPARWGGDEFVALLPGAPVERAREVAERLAAAVRAHADLARDAHGPAVTVSIGVAAAPDHASDPEGLFAAADRAMYHVKRRGRDGVAVAGTGAAQMLPNVDRFVGRTDELRGLVRCLDEALGGEPRVVVMVGEAGVGKTALARQLAPVVRLRGGSLVIGRTLEAALVQPPYAPWAGVVESLDRLRSAPPPTGATPAATATVVASSGLSPTPASIAALIGDQATPLGVRLPVTPLSLRAVVPEEVRWPELSRVVPALGRRAPNVAPTGSRFALLVELAAYIAEAARRHPLVVVLDDFHRADAASWDALEHVIAQLDREPVLLVVTVREEELSPEHLTRLRRIARDQRVRELALPRLTRDEVRQWAEAAFHGQAVGRDVLAFLYRQTEGNPLRVVQVLRTLVDERAVWWEGETWHWRPVSELRLPTALPELMARRLEKLLPMDRELLATAAVVGREFDIALVADAAEISVDALRPALERATRASVVQPAHGRGLDRLVFVHVLLMEALLTPLAPPRRRRMHARVAAALAARAPGEIATIAMHHDRAEESGPAFLGALAAAERARRVYGHEEAEQFLRVAERHAPDAASVAMVRATLAEVAEARGRPDEADELCALALDWYAAHGDARDAIRLRRMRERLRAALGAPARETQASLRWLVDEAAAVGATDERVALLGMLASTQLRLGEREAAVVSASEAVALAEPLGDEALLSDALLRAGAALDVDHPDAAEASFRRALALADARHDVRGQARAWDRLGVLAAHRGAWGEARAALRKAIELGRSAGMPDEWGLAALDLGVVARRTGDMTQAREQFGEALALFSATQNGERQLLALYHLAHLDRERGDVAAAAELYDVAASLAQRVGQHEVEVGALAAAGLCRLRLGQRAQAQHALARTEALVASRDDWFPGRELHDALAVEVVATLGDAAAVAARAQEAHRRALAVDPWAADWLVAELEPTLARLAPTALAELRAQRASATPDGIPRGARDAMRPLD